MDPVYFRRLAQYNAWANRRIYDAASELADAARKEPRPCFFGSIHRTLNHILVGDRLWLSRLTGGESGITSLDQELYGDFPELRAARKAEDGHLIEVVAGYDEAALCGILRYRSTEGEARQ